VWKDLSSGTSLPGLLSSGFSRHHKPPGHKTDHGNGDPGFFAAWEHFIVLGKPTPGGEPGERSLHNPMPFEHVEATGTDLFPIHFDSLWNPVLRLDDIVGEFGFHARNTANSGSKRAWFLNSPTMSHALEVHHHA